MPTGLPAELGPEDRPALLDLVRGIAAVVLGHRTADDVPADADLVDLGVDSLMAFELRNRLGSEVGLALPVTLAFARRTPALIADYVLDRLGTEHDDEPDLREVAARRGPERCPLSFQQQRLWSLNRMVPGSPAYNVALDFTFSGELDLPRLVDALAVVVDRHETLRTTFPDVDGEPWQQVAPGSAVPLPSIDLSDLPADERPAEFERIATAAARHVFDLATGPLLRLTLVRFGPAEHRLILVVHHIVIDAWSGYLLLREILTAYSAAVAGESAQLPELPVQYRDFARWERERLTGVNLERRLEYWRDQLVGDHPGLELPLDRPRPAVQTFEGASLRFTVEPDVVDGLRDVATEHGVTLFMTLVAALNVVLQRYGGDDDVVIGTPTASRHHPDIEDLVGFFVNTVVLRTDLGGDPTFAELLGRVSSVAREAYAHQDVPFELLVRELLPDRDMSMNPLFQVCFAMQPGARERWWDGSVLTDGREIRNGTCKFDLWISVLENDDGLAGEVEYSTDVFERRTIERIVESYRLLLRSVPARSSDPIWRLPVLSPADEHTVLTEWNRTGQAFPGQEGRCLHRLVEDAVDRHPDRVALWCDGETVTYAELDARANRLARRLRAGGVGRDERVGIYAERSPDLVAGLLAILKAGGAYVPIDPSYPSARVSFMLEDAAPRLLLVQTGLVAGLPAHTATVVLLDDDADGSADRPDDDAGPDDLAYLIYTSGSTGRPKAAMVTHRAIGNRLLWMQDAYRLTPDDRVLQKTPYSFDVSVWEFFWPLLVGARIVLARPDGHKDPGYLARLVQDQEVTTLHFVPSMLGLFLEDPQAAGCVSLVRVFASGEALSPAHVRRFRSVLGATALHNLYGPTEAAVDVMHWTCPVDPLPTTVPIGRPVANTSIYVLDRHRNPVPIGAVGELHIGGVQVARGYHARPELTAERFVDDPFSGEPGATLYRTGDLARFLPDGNVVYLGRTDFQIKVRGLRIEPGEIEAVLAEHPAVSSAVVVARSVRADGQQLVGYVVPANGEPARSGLRSTQVSQWQGVFDRTYGSGSRQERADFNIVGWDSSYSGLPLPAEDMAEWVDTTVERISRLGGRSILEVGCGTGLLLARLAPHTDRYWGTDISPEALRHVDEHLAPTLPDTTELRLLSCPADDLGGVGDARFDTIVLNSVAQYFPDVTYLVGVVEDLVSRLAPGGTLFLGDLRNLRLLEAFHTDVEVARAGPDDTVETVRARTRRQIDLEQELVVDPDLFAVLAARIPSITGAEVMLRRGTADNELNRFRYDVVLRTGGAAGGSSNEAPPVEMDGRGGVPAAATLLERDRPDVLVVDEVANARTAAAVARLKLVHSADGSARMADVPDPVPDGAAVDPEHWWRLGERLGYQTDVSWSPGTDDGRYRVVLRRAGRPPLAAPVARAASPSLHEMATSPLLVQISRRLSTEVRAFLRDKLPEFMIPSAVVAVPEFPTDANGKLDRAALPEPHFGSATGEDIVAPRTEEEAALATVWADVLGLDEVSVTSTFFSLGGDSLLAIRMVGRAAEHGLSLTPQDVFQNKSIADLAELARDRGTPVAAFAGVVAFEQAAPQTVARIRARFPDVEDVYPTTGTQSHILGRLRSARPESGGNVIHHRFHLTGARFDPGLLERAWQHVVDAFPALRTSFVHDEESGTDLQVVRAGVRLRIERHDWRRLPPAERHRRLHSYVVDRRARGFDPEGPLQMHVAVFRTGETEHEYVYLFSLAEHDGWSYMMIMKALLDAYETLDGGGEPTAPAANRTSFGEFCVAQAQRDRTEAEAFWRAELAGLALPSPVLTDPMGREVSAGSLPYLQETLVLPPDVTALLTEPARVRGLTAHTVVQGCWALLLGAVSGAPEVVLGTVFSGRATALLDVERTVGQFFVILPVRVPIDGTAELSDWLARLQDRVSAISRHEYVDPAVLHRIAGVPQDGYLFESYVVNETFGELESNFDRFEELLGAVPVEFVNQTEHPLRVEVAFARSQLLINLNHYAAYFPPGRVAALRDALESLLHAVAADPDQPVDRLLGAARAVLPAHDGERA